MPDNADEPRQIVRHLLGQLSEPEHAAIIRRRTEDPGFDEFCQAVEEELIDDFVQGRLSPEEARRFEEQYLVTPERAQKLEFARAMLRSFEKTSVRSRRFVKRTSAAIGVLVIAGATFLLWKSPATVVSYALLPGTVRDLEAPQTLSVPRSTLLLELHLRAETGLQSDHATLRAVGSTDELWRQRVVQKPDYSAEVLVPAAPLTAGDYLLTLQADHQPVASFHFRITRP